MSVIDICDVERAADCIWEDPRKDDFTIEPGQQNIFHRQVISITEDLNIDNKSKRISQIEVANLIREILFKVGEIKCKKGSDIDFEKHFEEVKQEIFSEKLSGSPNQFSVIFPLNIQILGSMPDEIDLGETSLEHISQSDWTDDYLKKAMDEDLTNLEAFYEENPNTPLTKKNYWSIWRIKYSARDANFAFMEVQEILQLSMAEINFSHNQWTSGMPRPSSDKAPNDRWSHLQLPFIFLAFRNGEYEKYKPLDYDYRGGLADRTFMPEINSFDELPNFYKQKDNLNEIDQKIVNALTVFQDGITEPRFRRSFFDFWRGIEHLAGHTDQANEKLVERAEFALFHVKDFENGLRPKTKEAINELADTRNKLIHEWPESRITERHRNAAKILLDGLLTLYLENRSKYELDDFEKLLKYGVKKQNEDLIQKIVETLERLDILD